MKLVTLPTALILASAIAAGCNRDSRSTTTDDRNDSAGKVADRDRQPAGSRAQMPITVTGCLQKGGFNTYILTKMTTPPQSIGTGGDDNGTKPSVTERDQIQAAENAYRIDPIGDVKLDELVGKQITVKGMIAERADLKGDDRNARTTGTGGNRNDGSDRQEIKAGDLAKIDATSVTKVAEQCGTAATRERPSSKR